MRRRVLLVAALAAAYAVAIEPRRLRVERWRVRVEGLPVVHEGLRLVHMSDFHAGMWLSSRAQLQRAVAAAVAARPSVAFLTGDFFHNGRLTPPADLFRPLAASCPTFAVLGNHDHAASPADTLRIREGLAAQGVRVLMNEHADAGVPGLPWRVVGIDDWATGHADLPRAVTGIAPGTRLLALLTHVPDVADSVPQGWFPLILAGHTHGLGLRLPSCNPLPGAHGPARLLHTRYPRGFYEVNGALLYVTRGVGVSELPARLGSLPEVTVLELTGGAALPAGIRFERATV